jgi:hypothetical protein
MSMNGYSIKRHGDGISIINHDLDGVQYEACYHADDVPELIALLKAAHDEWLAECAADYENECIQLAEAEGGGVRQREAELELRFSALGYDDIPF